jgi:spore maturation protein CgeB
VEEAYRGSSVARRINWYLRGGLPNRLDAFSDSVVKACREFAPEALLTTGMAPVNGTALDQIAVPRLNFLTDDPWNPAQHARWFLPLLPRYSRVFSPRRANLDDLRKLGCPAVSYLPFAYAPEIHFPEPPPAPLPDHDVVFVGGGDRDRFPPVVALVEAGIRVALYGGYWDRDARTRPFARGFVDPAGLRRVIGGSKVTLGLVRRANRDGHSMRTYEVPAMRGCLLPEDTPEHREILGDSVEYFRDPRDLVETARRLIADDALRSRVAESAYLRITGGENTYRDRLRIMLGTI